MSKDPPRLLSATYTRLPGRVSTIVYEFAGGYFGEFHIDNKFPKPNAPIVMLSEISGKPHVPCRFTGVIAPYGEPIEIDYEGWTDDPLIVNLAIEMRHNAAAGRLKNGDKLWPPAAQTSSADMIIHSPATAKPADSTEATPGS